MRAGAESYGLVRTAERYVEPCEEGVDNCDASVSNEQTAVANAQSSRVTFNLKGTSNVRSSFFAVRRSMCYLHMFSMAMRQ